MRSGFPARQPPTQVLRCPLFERRRSAPPPPGVRAIGLPANHAAVIDGLGAGVTMLRTLDLFAGIGGFSLGLERTGGFETVAFCEIDPYCQRVLAKHWPGVPIYDDIKEIVADAGCMRQLQPQGSQQEIRRRTSDSYLKGLDGNPIGPIDVITGGFPCQDISLAGKGAGIDGERSGLWSELARLIGDIRPRYAILENVAALLGRGLDRVAGDLAEIGYDCEWHCIPASAVGAPHRRDRVWIIAYPQYPDPKKQRSQRQLHNGIAQGWQRPILGSLRFCDGASDGQEWWRTEPDVGRVADGIPARVDRLRCLGNAVVPQIPELIGRAILAHG